jgi:hypothetical protein
MSKGGMHYHERANLLVMGGGFAAPVCQLLMPLDYYALCDHHHAASFVRMSSQWKGHARALVWPTPQ